MTSFRAADCVALRLLYERFRTASAANLAVSTRKPGEWLVVAPDTSDADLLERIIGRRAAERSADERLRELAECRLNEDVGAESLGNDIRFSWFRNGSSKTVHVRFVLVKQGKKHGGKGAPERHALPLRSASS